MWRRSIASVVAACFCVLMMCPVSRAAVADNGDMPRHRRPDSGFNGRPQRRPMDEGSADLAQLREQIHQLSKQVAKLQQTLDDRRADGPQQQMTRGKRPRGGMAGGRGFGRQGMPRQRFMNRQGGWGNRGVRGGRGPQRFMQQRGNLRGQFEARGMTRRGSMRNSVRNSEQNFGQNSGRGEGWGAMRGGGGNQNFMRGPGIRGPRELMDQPGGPRQDDNWQGGPSRGGPSGRPPRGAGRFGDRSGDRSGNRNRDRDRDQGQEPEWGPAGGGKGN